MKLLATKPAPSTADVPMRRKLAVGLELLADHAGRAREGVEFEPLLSDLAAYDQLLRRHGGPPLREARVLEIGYGARPYRLIALQSMGVDARGVDAESPILAGTVAEYLRAFRANGVERVAKSMVRHSLFDRRERRAFEHALARRGHELQIDLSRFEVCDAADLELPDRDLDLIFSEDVFEHVSRQSLERLLPRMRTWLRPGGIALIRPNVFTGITGGHLVEWNRRSFATGRARRLSEPWDHLRRRRFAPNTYLNELRRRDYRELFSRFFEILDEIVAEPDLGRELLTRDVRGDLADVPDEELFSNQVRFVLRRKPE
jgi:hypothetical protein